MLVVLFAWFGSANVWLAWQESQTIDEAVHLTAGYSYITTRDFRLNPEHPPLIKELSALPLLGLNVKNVKSLKGWASGDEWKAGKEFVYSSKASPRVIIFAARIMPIVIALMLGLLVFALAAYFSNRSFGLFALALYCLDPNIIAHSHYVTTDIAAAFGMLLTLSTLFYYINRPSVKRLALVGLSLGIALSVKFSTVILLLFVGLLMILNVIINQQKLSVGKKVIFIIKKVAFICLIAGLFLFATYGFETVRPSSNSVYSGNLANNNAIFNKVDNFYIPMYSYFRGLGRVFVHFGTGNIDKSVYLLGDYSLSKWYHFLITSLIKTPLATILAILVSFGIGCISIIKLIRKRRSAFVLPKKDWYILSLLLFVCVYLITTALTEFNINLRYVLPIYPVLFVLIATAFYRLPSLVKITTRKVTIASCLIIFGLGLSLASKWPFNLSYSNELWPLVDTNTYSIRLSDSNIDWGQDVYRLIDYAKLHPDTKYSYDISTNVDMAALGAPPNLQPFGINAIPEICKNNISGNIILSYQVIYDSVHRDFACFRGVRPNFTIGSSIVVFNR